MMGFKQEKLLYRPKIEKMKYIMILLYDQNYNSFFQETDVIFFQWLFNKDIL